MRKERKELALSDILLNEGQLGWLPRNPREWTQADIDNTAKSIEEDPDFLEDRPVLVVPYGKTQYIAFAGNLRHEGSVQLGRKTVPSVIYHPETEEDYATVKRRAMKDNGTFGSWDYDVLANEWDDLPLAEWGVPAWNTKIDVDDLVIEAPKDSGNSKTGYKSITFTMPEADALIVADWIKANGKDTLTNKIIELCRSQEVK